MTEPTRRTHRQGVWATLNNGRSLASELKHRADSERPFVSAHCQRHTRKCDGRLVVILNHRMANVGCECACHGKTGVDTLECGVNT